MKPHTEEQSSDTIHTLQLRPPLPRLLLTYQSAFTAPSCPHPAYTTPTPPHLSTPVKPYAKVQPFDTMLTLRFVAPTSSPHLQSLLHRPSCPTPPNVAHTLPTPVKPYAEVQPSDTMHTLRLAVTALAPGAHSPPLYVSPLYV